MFFVIMFYVVFSVLYILLSDLGILPTNLFMDVVCLSSSNTLRFLLNASCKHLVLLGWAIGFRIFTYSVLSSSGFCSIYKPYKSMLAKLIAHFFSDLNSFQVPNSMEECLSLLKLISLS